MASNNPPPVRTFTHALNDAEQAFAAKKILEYIETNNLEKQTPDNPGPKLERVTRGGKKARERSLGAWNGYIRELGYFAVKIGDFKTAALCDRDLCPLDPLPASPRTIALYYKWKTGDKDTVLSEPDNNRNKVYEELGLLMDDSNKGRPPIKCTGQWNSPSGIEGARTAFIAMHKLYDTTRDAMYQNACLACVDANNTPCQSAASVDPSITKEKKASNSKEGLETRANWQSCRLHANFPILMPRGNAVNDHVAATTYGELHAYLTETHEVRGNIQILPRNLRKLRKALLAEGLSGLQKWCMTILGAKLFLRVNELLCIQVKDFQCDLNIVHPNSIKSLCLRITNLKAKKDEPKFQDVMIYRDEKCPEFCPLDPLLTYIWSSNIRGGYLFPKTEELLLWAGDELEKERLTLSKKPIIAGHNDGHFTTQWKYQDWLNTLKSLLSTYCRMESSDCARVGTHTLRKTGYLMAIWGMLQQLEGTTRRDGDAAPQAPPRKLSALWENEIMKSARHRSIQNASKYILDAFSLHGICSRERFQEENFVSDFVGIIVERSSRSNAKQLMVHSKPYQKKDIIEQTVWWIEHVVKETMTRDAEELLKIASRPVMPEEDLVALILAEVPESRRAHVEPKLLRLKKEAARGLYDELVPVSNANKRSVPDSIAIDKARSKPQQTKRKSRSGNSSQTSSQGSSSTTSRRPKKTPKQRAGTIELADVRAKANKLEKMRGDKENKRLLYNIYDEAVMTYKNNQKVLVEKARSWWKQRNKTHEGFKSCIANCCNGDFEAWLEMPWPKAFTKAYVCPCVKYSTA